MVPSYGKWCATWWRTWAALCRVGEARRCASVPTRAFPGLPCRAPGTGHVSSATLSTTSNTCSVAPPHPSPWWWTLEISTGASLWTQLRFSCLDVCACLCVGATMPLNLAGLCCWKAASQFGTAISIGPQKGLRRAFFLFFLWHKRLLHGSFYGVSSVSGPYDCGTVFFIAHLPYLIFTIMAHTTRCRNPSL